ncbi:MAG: hypothetical protein HY517_01865, partial [Candidatus Aenigmarchaeota archaeon]|nr:hypothetical protein [Candidatus Aenigmarchaeota archaeon]
NWEFPKIMRSMINKFALDDIAFFSSNMENFENRDFFTLALLNASIKVSWAWKDGGVIKIKKHPVPPLRKLFQRVVYRMIKDVEDSERSEATTQVLQQDARKMSLEDESVDAIITSPPYLNNIDYTRLYAIEDFFMKMRHIPTIRSFMGFREVEQAEAYFDDMKEFLSEAYRVIKRGSYAAIIIGNAYIGREVETDFILSHLASEVGFEVEKILVLNKRFALENRTQKVGTLRESLIILKKN